MAPTVFAASSRPALVATLPSRPATSAEEAGKLRPMTIVAGRTTTRTRQKRTLISPSMRAASTVNWTGCDRTKTTPARARRPTITLACARSATGRRIQRRTRVNSTAPIAIPARKTIRISVKTYV